MTSAAANAPLFIEAFYKACHGLNAGPPLSIINQILANNNTGFQINLPNLEFTGEVQHVAASISTPSLEADAQSIVQQSLGQIQKAVAEGRSRQAVQESLWLLETVATAFRGEAIAESQIEGKYFNKIAQELRRDGSAPNLKQVIDWMFAFHGYLSSPQGGGVRHGADIRNPLRMSDNDALLYCNLTRSYIAYLIGEHQRITAHQT